MLAGRHRPCARSSAPTFSDWRNVDERRRDAPSGSVLTPEGWVRGRVEIADGRIAGVSGATAGDRRGSAQRHGCCPASSTSTCTAAAAHDWQGGEEAVRGLARFHAARGTVALAPTTATAQVPVIERALGAITAVKADAPAGRGDRARGPSRRAVHQPRQARCPGARGARGRPRASPRDGRERFSIRVATVAPEIPGGLSVIETLSSRGTRVQIAHSLATAEQAAAGFRGRLLGFHPSVQRHVGGGPSRARRRGLCAGPRRSCRDHRRPASRRPDGAARRGPRHPEALRHLGLDHGGPGRRPAPLGRSSGHQERPARDARGRQDAGGQRHHASRCLPEPACHRLLARGGVGDDRQPAGRTISAWTTSGASPPAPAPASSYSTETCA